MASFLTFRPLFCKQINHNIAQRRFKKHRHDDVPDLARSALRANVPRMRTANVSPDVQPIAFVLATPLPVKTSQQIMETIGPTVGVVLLLVAAVTSTEPPPRQLNTVRNRGGDCQRHFGGLFALA